MNNTSSLVSFVETTLFFGMAWLLIMNLYAVFAVLYGIMLLLLWRMHHTIETDPHTFEHVGSTLYR